MLEVHGPNMVSRSLHREAICTYDLYSVEMGGGRLHGDRRLHKEAIYSVYHV